MFPNLPETIQEILVSIEYCTLSSERLKVPNPLKWISFEILSSRLEPDFLVAGWFYQKISLFSMTCESANERNHWMPPILIWNWSFTLPQEYIMRFFCGKFWINPTTSKLVWQKGDLRKFIILTISLKARSAVSSISSLFRVFSCICALHQSTAFIIKCTVLSSFINWLTSSRPVFVWGAWDDFWL